MSLVPAGYKLLLQRPNDEIFWSEDLEGYDLTKIIARGSLIGEISEQLEKDLANLDEGGETDEKAD